MSELKKKFGRRLQELRKRNGISQENFAEKIGISPRNLSKIETGITFPSADNLEKIIFMLNCPAKELFDFEHHKDNSDLEKEIIDRIKNFSRQRLRDIYKITDALTD